jgi:hypothetical protein
MFLLAATSAERWAGVDATIPTQVFSQMSADRLLQTNFK